MKGEGFAVWKGRLKGWKDGWMKEASAMKE
jgi:hypothetical protein